MALTFYRIFYDSIKHNLPVLTQPPVLPFAFRDVNKIQLTHLKSHVRDICRLHDSRSYFATFCALTQ